MGFLIVVVVVIRTLRYLFRGRSQSIRGRSLFRGQRLISVDLYSEVNVGKSGSVNLVDQMLISDNVGRSEINVAVGQSGKLNLVDPRSISVNVGRSLCDKHLELPATSTQELSINKCVQEHL